AAQWDPKKLNWVNAHYLKQMPLDELASLVTPRIERRGGVLAGAASLPAVLELLVPRAETLEQLAEEAMLFYAPFDPAHTPADLIEKHLTNESRAILRDFAVQADGIEWNRVELSALMKATLGK